VLDLLIADDLRRPGPVSPEQYYNAEIVRMLAREAVTPMAPSASYQVMRKLNKLLQRPGEKKTPAQRIEQKKIRLQLRILRLAARKAPKIRKSRKTAAHDKIPNAAHKPSRKPRRASATESAAQSKLQAQIRSITPALSIRVLATACRN
jgi:hypothetical protein